MNCSHGLAYEVKCSQCFSEAMARVNEHLAAEIWKQKGVALPVEQAKQQGLQEELDCIQGLS